MYHSSWVMMFRQGTRKLSRHIESSKDLIHDSRIDAQAIRVSDVFIDETREDHE